MAGPEPEAVRADILLVDDREDQLFALLSVVETLQQNVVTARSGREALRAILHHDFAVIILDVNMPGMDGYETAALIRQRRNSEHTPIIFVSAGINTETHVSQGYSLGAVDYIQRPVVPEVLRAKVGVFVELYKKSAEVRALQEAEHRRQMQETQSMLEVQTKRNLFFVLSLDMLGIIGFDGRVKQMNPAWEKSLGFTADELQESLLEEFVHPEDRDSVRHQLRRVSAGTEVTYFESRFRCHDESFKWFAWTAAPFRPGELIYLFARDITERRHVEEERTRRLAAEEERGARLRLIAAASIAMHSTVAIEEILSTATEHARRVLGATRAEGCLAVDNNWSTVHRAKSQEDGSTPRDALALEDAGIDAVLRDLGGPLRRSAEELADDPQWQDAAGQGVPGLGVRNCICAPLTGRGGGNMGYLALCDRMDGDFTAEDESQLVQLAQMASLAITNALYYDAREANRLKDEFLATLSHELRTPLTAILGWTWLLQSGDRDAADLEQAMEIIERNARAQAKLIDDMLDISRITSGKLRLQRQPVSFQAVVEAAVGAMRPAAQAKGIGLEMEIGTNLPPTSGDADRLHQVVSNLMSNAIKFTPEGGRVDVRLEGNPSQIRLTVRDTGIGIAPGFLPHVFERFLQAEAGSARPQGGLGLGLAIVHHLVELHGGSVEAQSDGEGRGASFVVTLPAAPEATAAATESRALVTFNAGLRDAAQCSLAGLRILVVDDDADSRATITMVLREFDADVAEAGSAAEGMTQLCRGPRRSVDLVVSDIAMPGEDGCTFMRRVRGMPGHSGDLLPALAVSAFVREEDRARALEAGFQAHLPKPVVPHQLIAAVAGLLSPRTSA